MATQNELAAKVLQKLGIIDANGTARNADLTLITDKYSSFYENLKAEDLVSWGSGDDIPNTHLIPIVGLLARECLEDFTVSPSVATLLMGDEERYRNQLKRLEYQYYVPDSRAEYY